MGIMTATSTTVNPSADRRDDDEPQPTYPEAYHPTAVELAEALAYALVLEDIEGELDEWESAPEIRDAFSRGEAAGWRDRERASESDGPIRDSDVYPPGATS